MTDLALLTLILCKEGVRLTGGHFQHLLIMLEKVALYCQNIAYGFSVCFFHVHLLCVALISRPHPTAIAATCLASRLGRR
jgi:hypothetical protein